MTRLEHLRLVDEPREERHAGGRTLAAMRGAQPLIRFESAVAEEARTLTPAVVGALREAGVFRMTTPRERGGPELTPIEQFRVLEAVSVADGSAGWTAHINSMSGYFTAYLDTDVARAMFPSIDIAVAGMPIPVGRAVEADGGYRVDGRWTFGTGILNAGWVLCGCRVYDKDGEPVKMPDGSPATVSAWLPFEQVEVLDTWDSLGLRGTGSHDYEVHDVFVPRERTLDVLNSPLRVDRPLYRWPMMFLFNQSAVALGIARAAVDAFAGLAHTKRLPQGPLHEQEYARVAVAQAHATISSARAYCLATLEDVWSSLEHGIALTLEQRANFRLALTHAMRGAGSAVDEVFRAAGSSAAVRRGTVLERCFRDVHSTGQHMSVSPATIGVTGGMLIGDAPGDPRY